MKQIIITTLAFAVGAGAASFLLHLQTRSAHKKQMTFAELYEDNLYSANSLLD